MIRALVCKPTLERQEEVLRRYFTPDVQFFHFNIDNKGLANLIASYQMTELLVNYQDVTFHHIAYDEGQHILAVHMTVQVRALPKFFVKDSLRFHMLLELEQRQDPVDGRNKHYIRVQRDFFVRDPLVQLLPVIGTVYNSGKLRLLLGRSYAALFRGLRFIYCSALPTRLQKSLYHLWLRGPHGKSNAAGAAQGSFLAKESVSGIGVPG